MKQVRYWIAACILLLSVWLPFAPVRAEGAHPIKLTVTVDPALEMEEAGEIPSLLFTIANTSQTPYTLYNARLSGGFDGMERVLNEQITIDADSTREFTLENVPIAENQFDSDVSYTLEWTEVVPISTPVPETSTPAESEAPTEMPAEGETTSETTSEPTPEPTVQPTSEPETRTIQRSTTATVRIARFVPPELVVTATVQNTMVSVGESFTVTYHITNDTKYDMTALSLTDTPYTGRIPLPSTELMAGGKMDVPIEYTMGDIDLTFCPVVSYIAAQRQVETSAKDTITVGSVVIGVRLDVQQYPSNEEGTTFAITVVNTGNRSMYALQLYDEIHSEIDKPFDLGPQQQKVLTFSVPSAYASGLIRTVQFQLTGKDCFQSDFTYTDPNQYECVPYVASDAVRLSLLVTLMDAYYDEAGKLCGQIQFEIRNYSDVRVVDATLSELSLFGTVQTYPELQRGETFYTVVYQLDQVESLSFRVSAADAAGQQYATETIVLNLEQLPSLAARSDQQTIIYHSNTFLQELADRITSSLRSILIVTLILVLVSSVICGVLWFLEYRIRARIPRESLLSLRVPAASKTPTGTLDHVLSGSPAEQFGYVAPAKLRYSQKPTEQRAKPVQKSTEPPKAQVSRATLEKRSESVWAKPAQNHAAQEKRKAVEEPATPKPEPIKPYRKAEEKPVKLYRKPEHGKTPFQSEPEYTPVEQSSAHALMEQEPGAVPVLPSKEQMLQQESTPEKPETGYDIDERTQESTQPSVPESQSDPMESEKRISEMSRPELVAEGIMQRSGAVIAAEPKPEFYPAPEPVGEIEETPEQNQTETVEPEYAEPELLLEEKSPIPNPVENVPFERIESEPISELEPVLAADAVVTAEDTAFQETGSTEPTESVETEAPEPATSVTESAETTKPATDAAEPTEAQESETNTPEPAEMPEPASTVKESESAKPVGLQTEPVLDAAIAAGETTKSVNPQTIWPRRLELHPVEQPMRLRPNVIVRVG